MNEKPRKVIGYLRVSTINQDLEKNKADILTYANDHDLGKVHFVQEVVSGKVSWKRRRIKEVIDQLGKDDWLIVPELSRLGRSMLDILEIIQEAKEKGINIYAIKNNWTLDNSMESKIILMVFSMAAEIERDLISSRTKEALRVKKESGVTLGRPKGPGKSKLDEHQEEIIALLRNGVPKKRVASKYGSSAVNLYNWIDKNRLDVAARG
ncbi:recombinase family protein [Syntrophus buswellii]|uniref:recombinase family protein n=1 Tax=Syntrophus buswellii TaxID=43774 RepID=UPI0038D49F60